MEFVQLVDSEILHANVYLQAGSLIESTGTVKECLNFANEVRTV